jgi:hypothetical protein
MVRYVQPRMDSMRLPLLSVLSLGAVRAQPFCNDALLAVTPQLQTVVRTT